MRNKMTKPLAPIIPVMHVAPKPCRSLADPCVITHGTKSAEKDAVPLTLSNVRTELEKTRQITLDGENNGKFVGFVKISIAGKHRNNAAAMYELMGMLNDKQTDLRVKAPNSDDSVNLRDFMGHCGYGKELAQDGSHSFVTLSTKACDTLEQASALAEKIDTLITHNPKKFSGLINQAVLNVKNPLTNSWETQIAQQTQASSRGL